MRSTEYRSTARRRAAAPRAARRPGSASRRSNWVAKPRGSSEAASTPASPTTSTGPPLAGASTGRPHAIASARASPNVSSGRVWTTHVAALYAPTSVGGSTWPRNVAFTPSCLVRVKEAAVDPVVDHPQLGASQERRRRQRVARVLLGEEDGHPHAAEGDPREEIAGRFGGADAVDHGQRSAERRGGGVPDV